jgi:acetylornithine deacetylase
MRIDTMVEKELLQYADERRADLVEMLQTLVRTPSENTPPTGAEGECQRYCESVLRAAGFATDLYELNEVAGLAEHPLFVAGRDYSGRPNLAGRRAGTGGGRSLILSGHIDTVPRGTLPWTRDPFSGHIENGRLYGRGSNDMKAGIAANLFVAKAIHDLGIALRGDLVIESIVDEEFGGVNGTLAGRVRGYLADAAVISEPSFLRICPAQRGGRTVHITLEVPGEGILGDSMEAGVADQLAWVLSQIPAFAERRRATAPRHFAYEHLANPVPVSVLKIHTGQWGTGEPMATATRCRVELFWQTMPGETLEAVDGEFHEWFDGAVAARPDLFPEKPRLEFPIRWLPGSSCPGGAELIGELSGCAAEVLGSAPAVAGIEGPCDMYVFQQHYGMPAVIWGARGGNTHLADEYVELDTVYDAAKTLLLFAYRWCR